MHGRQRGDPPSRFVVDMGVTGLLSGKARLVHNCALTGKHALYVCVWQRPQADAVKSYALRLS